MPKRFARSFPLRLKSDLKQGHVVRAAHMDMKNPRSWYGGSRFWRRRAKRQLEAEPLCRRCLERGVVTPGAIADHCEPVGGSFERFKFGALQTLCKECHGKSKQREERRGYRDDIAPDTADLPGWPTDPRHPANAPQKAKASAKPSK